MRLFVLPLIAIAFLAGCGSSNSNSGDRLAVVASTTQVGDFTRAVGGDEVAVTQLLNANADPHDYEPRPNDVKATASATLVLASGLDLDHWVDSVVKQSGGDAKVIDIGDHLPVERAGEEEHHDGEEADEHAGATDPHWWHDPRNARTAVERIRDALTEADPDNASDYRANAAAYLTKVDALDRGIASCIDSVPLEKRKLVTDHDAFGYFTDRYGIEVVGAVIPSQTTQAQPNAKDIAALADLIKREHVQAIFPESSLSPKLAQALADQTGITSEYTLYGDTLGPKGSSGATYLTMERANADAMVRGFTGGAEGCPIAGIG